MDLAGSLAVVTGGARGIGHEVTVQLAARGARVVIGDLDAALAAEVAVSVGGHAHELDVADPASIAAFMTWIEREHGPVDVLVNNAGIMPLGPHLEESPDLTEKIFAVNVFGPTAMIRGVVPGMVARRRGHIVNVASSAGLSAVPGGVTYSSSKAALLVLTEGLRRELQGTGLGVTAVLPGIVATDLSAGVHARGVGQVTPGQVATRIVRAIETGRQEVWVPRRLRVMPPLLWLLPRSARERLVHALGADTAFTAVDPQSRAQYESRIRGGVDERS